MALTAVTAPNETTDGLPQNNGTLWGNRPVGRSVRCPVYTATGTPALFHVLLCTNSMQRRSWKDKRRYDFRFSWRWIGRINSPAIYTVKFGTVAIYNTATPSQSYSKITSFNGIQKFTIVSQQPEHGHCASTLQV